MRATKTPSSTADQPASSPARTGKNPRYLVEVRDRKLGIFGIGCSNDGVASALKNAMQKMRERKAEAAR